MDCGTLTDPANGQVSHTTGTTFGHPATYSCDLGYNLVGENNRSCQATGRWSGNTPTCQGKLLTKLYTACVHIHKHYFAQKVQALIMQPTNLGKLLSDAGYDLVH